MHSMGGVGGNAEHVVLSSLTTRGGGGSGSLMARGAPSLTVALDVSCAFLRNRDDDAVSSVASSTARGMEEERSAALQVRQRLHSNIRRLQQQQIGDDDGNGSDDDDRDLSGFEVLHQCIGFVHPNPGETHTLECTICIHCLYFCLRRKFPL